MKTILIILPYFGRFPNYFQLYLNSCQENRTINWHLITDQDINGMGLKIPDNMFVENSTFRDVQTKIKALFGSEIKEPYQLCNYKPAYFEIFDSKVKDYDYWGYGDCDLLFGNLREHITDEILSKYDKISWRGHLTLLKNRPDVNNIYKIELPGFKHMTKF